MIAVERKLGWLARLKCVSAFEDEPADNLSDFGSKGHEVDEARRKFAPAAEKKEDGL